MYDVVFSSDFSSVPNNVVDGVAGGAPAHHAIQALVGCICRLSWRTVRDVQSSTSRGAGILGHPAQRCSRRTSRTTPVTWVGKNTGGPFKTDMNISKQTLEPNPQSPSCGILRTLRLIEPSYI